MQGYRGVRSPLRLKRQALGRPEQRRHEGGIADQGLLVVGVDPGILGQVGPAFPESGPHLPVVRDDAHYFW